MSHASPTSETPNVVIENPVVRKRLRLVLDIVGALTFIAAGVDLSSDAFDISAFTVPILNGYGIARVVFGLAIDTPNTPTR